MAARLVPGLAGRQPAVRAPATGGCGCGCSPDSSRTEVRLARSARGGAHAKGESRAGGVAPGDEFYVPCLEEADAVWADDIARLGDRCQLDLGRMVVGSDPVRLQVESDAVPTGDKSDMLRDYVPEYMAADRVDWSTLSKNIIANDHQQFAGLYFDEGGGVPYRATLHALQMIAGCPMRDAAGANMKERYDRARSDIRNGRLPLVLSTDGAGAESAIVVTSDGRVASAFLGDSDWHALTSLWRILLSRWIWRQAALADYLLWWAWRLHSESGGRKDEGYYTGLAAARFAFAEISVIGAFILHESVHLYGEGPHCDDSGGTNCPHDRMMAIWMARAAANYDLPASYSRKLGLTHAQAVPEKVARQQANGRRVGGTRELDTSTTIDDLDLLRTPSECYFGGSADSGADSGTDCAAGDAEYIARITFALGHSEATASWVVPAGCSSTGKERSNSVDL